MILTGSKVKIRLIIICIILGTIPTIVVGIFSVYKGSQAIQDKVDEGNMRNLVQIQMSVEQLLYTADHIMLQFIETPAVKSSLQVDLTGNEFKIFNTVEDAINNLPTYSLGASEICFANLQKGWVIDNSGIYKLENYAAGRYLNEFIKRSESSFWIDELAMKTAGVISESEHIDCICLVKKWPLFISNPSYIAVMKIPHSKFASLISNNESLGEVLIIGDDGYVIAHPDREEWGKDYRSVSYYRELSNVPDKQGKFIIKINNVDYSVNYLKSGYNGWTYISITSLADVTKDSKAIWWFTFTACVAVIVIVNLAALIVSDRIYKPVEKIYKLLVSAQEREAYKKHDEFRLIEERINYLMKDNKRMNKQLSVQFNQLKEFFILKLILSRVDQVTVDSRIRLYGYPDNGTPMCVLVTRIDTFDGTMYNDGDKDLMLFAINNVAGELLEQEIVLKPVVVEEYQVTIIKIPGGRLEDIREAAFKAAEKLQSVVKKMLDLSVSVGISEPVYSYKDIHKGYSESLEALKHQLSLGYKAIIFYQDVKELGRINPVFPEELEKELLDAVKTCSFEKAKEMLNQFISRVFMVEASRYEYQTALVRLLTNLVLILKETGESKNVIAKDGISVYEKLFALKTAKEIEKWFLKEIIKPIIKYIENSEKKQYKKIVEGVLNIIHEQYHTELTLEDCAARLNYHPSYIRRILKNESGIVFSEYLAQYRIDVAKKWLTETNMKISEIAGRLKYKNTENFIRFFKKITGVTPGKYRKMNQCT